MSGGGGEAENSLSQFDAAASMLGYKYQTRIALLYVVERLLKKAVFSILMEKYDDFSIEEKKGGRELIQVKHSMTEARTVSDRSRELWKSIRVWSEFLRSEDGFEAIEFLLWTTSEIKPGSIASHLACGTRDRNDEEARRLLEDVANGQANNENDKAFRAFLDLSISKRRKLVRSITIIPNQVDITKIEQSLESRLGFVAPPGREADFRDALLGWWEAQAARQLADYGRTPISSSAVRNKIEDLRNRFRRTNLPVDDALAARGTVAIDISDHVDRMFVHQMRIVALTEPLQAVGINDYLKASEQRSIWLRRGLVTTDEMSAYESKLENEWELQHALQITELDKSASNCELQAAGRRVYKWGMNCMTVKLRNEIDDMFLSRGTFHRLADDLRVGWHPNFDDICRED